MGTTTLFAGEFKLNKPLTPELKDYLEQFNMTRHVKFDVTTIKKNFKDWKTNRSFNKNLGCEGEYFLYTFAEPDNGRKYQEAVINYNTPPTGVPGLWCQWVPDEDGTAIVWDRNEKFHNYEEWLCYIIKHFLEPEGYILNGTMVFVGEDEDDRGYLTVENNHVRKEYDPNCEVPSEIWDE